MRDFVRPAGRLRMLPLPARLVYSVFNLFSLLALAETAWLGADMVGANLEGVEAYYAGKSGAPPSAAKAPDPAAGPVIELPDEPLTAEAAPMPLRKLLEVTHFHLFTMPVYLLILAHLFMLSRIHAGVKIGFILGGSLGVLLHMLAPWVARSGSAGSVLFYAISGVLLLVCMLVMSSVPLVEMWAPLRRGGKAHQ
jgi:hypothetical protein